MLQAWQKQWTSKELSFFAGLGAITRGLQAKGWAVYPYEKEDDKLVEDILNDEGYCFALSLVLRCRIGAILWFGIVCSSWVFMSRGSTGRYIFDIRGHIKNDAVHHGNIMCSRVILLMWISIKHELLTILEQPTTSIMYMWKRFQDMFGAILIYK